MHKHDEIEDVFPLSILDTGNAGVSSNIEYPTQERRLDIRERKALDQRYSCIGYMSPRSFGAHLPVAVICSGQYQVENGYGA